MDRRVHAIARSVGVRLSRRSIQGAYSYDGETIAIRGRRHVCEASDVLHDIAHYVVCPVERRHLPEFGLGTAPDQERMIESDPYTAPIEEQRASLLGIAWEFAIGLNGAETLRWHTWDEGALTRWGTFWETVAWLRAHGHLDEAGQPTAVRAWRS